MQPARITRRARCIPFKFVSVLSSGVAAAVALIDYWRRSVPRYKDRAAGQKRLLISAARRSLIGAGIHILISPRSESAQRRSLPANCRSFN